MFKPKHGLPAKHNLVSINLERVMNKKVNILVLTFAI